MVVFNNFQIPLFNDSFCDWKEIVIDDNQEKLISLREINSKIVISPQYYYNNIIGAVNDCFVRESIAKKLNYVANHLPKSYKLVVFDGWRPFKVQQNLFDNYNSIIKLQFPQLSHEEVNSITTQYVSLPSTNIAHPSPHITGGAIDLSLLDENDELVNMGTKFDDFTECAKTDYFEGHQEMQDIVSIEIRENRRVLFYSMLDQGFTNYPFEWWHYDYGNQFWAFGSKQKKAFYGISHI
jgi:zinc D-Ala-D-Ala dipeptidase